MCLTNVKTEEGETLYGHGGFIYSLEVVYYARGLTAFLI